MKSITALPLALATAATAFAGDLPYPVADTGQVTFYDNSRSIDPPGEGEPFHGQDAGYAGNKSSYRDNDDGTVTDLVTGLMWQQDPGEKMTCEEAARGASRFSLAGHNDWRLPTIKELYSLIDFSGTDPDPHGSDTSSARPFIDTRHFKFRYGDASKGERIIDSQFATSTKYVGKTMGGNETMFGVNFADGRIKGYPTGSMRGRRSKTYHVLYVRENTAYGKNDFKDNGDGTVTDRATGLTWMKQDSGHLKAGPKGDGGMNWQQALEWAEKLDHSGHDDWRLPNAKELQSIVDYTRSPDTTGSAAIDPVFECSEIKNEGGRKDFPQYWTGTTHASQRRASAAAYLAFGRGSGWMSNPRLRDSEPRFLDVHGAGCQRSDPKAGDPSRFPHGRGPQGDVIRIYNHVRCVRGGAATPNSDVAELGRVRAEQTPPDHQAPRPPADIDPPPPPPPPGHMPPPHFDRLDQDDDGKVSRREFDGPRRHFRELDKNDDGYLSPDEFPKRPPPRR